MDSTNETLIFQIENKDKGNIIYQYEIDLMKFQKETLENENVSFFYVFKDMSVELEEAISAKLKLRKSKDELIFIVKYSDKVLHKSPLDVAGIEEEDMSHNEVELYFIFDKISKMMINRISKEHKNIILSNTENS
jgi:hypothetical protein